MGDVIKPIELVKEYLWNNFKLKPKGLHISHITLVLVRDMKDYFNLLY